MSSTSPIDGEHTAKSRALWFELIAVVLIGSSTSIQWIVCSLFWGGDYQRWENRRHPTETKSAVASEKVRDETRGAMAFEVGRIDLIILHLRYVPIVLYVFWRSGEPWSYFGLSRPKYIMDVPLGVALWLIITAAFYLVRPLLHSPHIWLSPRSAFLPEVIPLGRGALLALQCSCTAVSEELVARGYVIPRFESITGSTWKAVVISMALWIFFHLHKDWIGIEHSLICAAVWGIAFCFTRRIWPGVIAHAIIDYIPLAHS